MSTKIYDGKILPSMSLHRLHEWQRSLREKVVEKTEELFAKEMAECLTDLIHYACLHTEEELSRMLDKEFPNEKFDSSYAASSVAFLGLYRKAKKAMVMDTRDLKLDHFDYRAKLVVFPIQQKLFGIPIRRKLLALFHAELNDLHILWEGYSGVRPYGYWNNTDKPNELSDRQWCRRSKEWEEALGGYRGGTLDNGLVYTFVNDVPLVKPHEAVKYIKPYEERLQEVSFNRLHNRLFREELKKNPEDENGYGNFTHWSNLLKKTKLFIESEEGQILLTEEKEFILTRLPVDLTPDILQEELRNFCTPSEWSGWMI